MLEKLCLLFSCSLGYFMQQQAREGGRTDLEKHSVPLLKTPVHSQWCRAVLLPAPTLHTHEGVLGVLTSLLMPEPHTLCVFAAGHFCKGQVGLTETGLGQDQSTWHLSSQMLSWGLIYI